MKFNFTKYIFHLYIKILLSDIPTHTILCIYGYLLVLSALKNTERDILSWLVGFSSRWKVEKSSFIILVVANSDGSKYLKPWCPIFENHKLFQIWIWGKNEEMIFKPFFADFPSNFITYSKKPIFITRSNISDKEL